MPEENSTMWCGCILGFITYGQLPFAFGCADEPLELLHRFRF